MRTSPFQSISKNPVISERPIDEARPLKVIFIGAGISGIIAGIKLPQILKNLHLVIYDKNPEIGGTWWENRYPGCACDIPAHSYQLSFESNPEWSKFYASSQEILEYWKRIVQKYNVEKYIKLRTQALEASWDSEAAKWVVTLKNIETGQVFQDSADALLTGIGVLNDWKWPDIPGLHDFQGKLLHSADWDSSYDYKNKRVAVIGAGSSGIQIVPSIQPHVQHIDHYVRGKTWIAPSFGSKFVEERNNGVDGNFAYTDKEIEEFKSNPAEYMKYRRSLEEDMQGIFSLTHRGSLAQRAARDHFETLMKMRLSANPDLMEYMIPSSAPCCRRLTPGPGYLEALGAENVTMISTRIEKITPTGVITSDNIHREVDAIMCATGFDASFLSRFRIQGLGGVSLAERWTKSQKHSSYLSITTNDFPNFFMCLGPNSGVGNGSLVIMLESYVAYAAQCLAKLQTENIRTIAPKQEVVQAFTSFCHAYFERTVFSEDCSSWYKTSYPSLSSGQLAPAADKAENGNVTSEACSDTPELHVRVTALWPGSSLHAVKALAKPRWEDFEYTYMDGNNLGWLGDGWTEGDRAAERGFVVGNPDLSYYLKEGFLDGKT